MFILWSVHLVICECQLNWLVICVLDVIHLITLGLVMGQKMDGVSTLDALTFSDWSSGGEVIWRYIVICSLDSD